jgi:hypothetical protein
VERTRNRNRLSGADRDRTGDPRLAKPVLSQLSYNPKVQMLVGLARLELATSALSGLRSNHLSYRPFGKCVRDTSFQRPDRSLKTESDAAKRSGGLDRARVCIGLQTLMLLRKEVIQPQVPLRLPCYDFTPVIDHSLGTYFPCGLDRPLLEQSTPMV